MKITSNDVVFFLVISLVIVLLFGIFCTSHDNFGYMTEDRAVYVEEFGYGFPFAYLIEWRIEELAVTTQRFIIPAFLINWGITTLIYLVSAIIIEKIKDFRKAIHVEIITPT